MIEKLNVFFTFGKMIKQFWIKEISAKLLAMSALIWIFSCHSHTKVTIRERWDNGNSKLVYTYSNSDDTLSYLYESFYQNGRPEGKGHFVNGKMDGSWLWLFENGNKKDEATLIQGFYTGQRKHWNTDGTLKKIEFISKKCAEECCDGKIVFYYPSGRKLAEYPIINGEWNGVGFSYLPTGKLNKKFTYVNGKKNGEFIDYDTSGRIMALGNYKDDESDGVWINKDNAGHITQKFSYKNGLFDGPDTLFDINGKPKICGYFINGNEEGEKLYYSSSGKLEKRQYYISGRMINK